MNWIYCVHHTIVYTIIPTDRHLYHVYMIYEVFIIIINHLNVDIFKIWNNLLNFCPIKWKDTFVSHTWFVYGYRAGGGACVQV